MAVRFVRKFMESELVTLTDMVVCRSSRMEITGFREMREMNLTTAGLAELTDLGQYNCPGRAEIVGFREVFSFLI